MSSNKNIAVIGGGSWATAIVKILCNNCDNINWWVRNSETARYIQKYHHNPNYISSVEFEAKNISVSSDLKEVVSKSDVLIVAVPSAFLKESLSSLKAEDMKNKKIFSGLFTIHRFIGLFLRRFQNAQHKIILFLTHGIRRMDAQDVLPRCRAHSRHHLGMFE